MEAILRRVSSSADIATVTLVGSSAFLLDAGLDVATFLQPGMFGLAAAGIGLGVKKAFEPLGEYRRRRKMVGDIANLMSSLAKSIRQESDSSNDSDIVERNAILVMVLDRNVRLLDEGLINREDALATYIDVCNDYTRIPERDAS